MTDYLTVAEVLAMHADQIERYGGSHGIRDQGNGKHQPQKKMTDSQSLN